MREGISTSSRPQFVIASVVPLVEKTVGTVVAAPRFFVTEAPATRGNDPLPALQLPPKKHIQTVFDPVLRTKTTPIAAVGNVVLLLRVSVEIAMLELLTVSVP
jgi:hypothetical protein